MTCNLPPPPHAQDVTYFMSHTSFLISSKHLKHPISPTNGTQCFLSYESPLIYPRLAVTHSLLSSESRVIFVRISHNLFPTKNVTQGFERKVSDILLPLSKILYNLYLKRTNGLLLNSFTARCIFQ